MSTKKQDLNGVLKSEAKPRVLPKFANFRQKDVICHDIHRTAPRTLCGLKLDSRKEPLKCTENIPNGYEPCKDCETVKAEIAKRKKQNMLNRRFEAHKGWVQRTASQKKNTLGRKQVFNARAKTFDMSTPDESFE